MSKLCMVNVHSTDSFFSVSASEGTPNFGGRLDITYIPSFIGGGKLVGSKYHST